MTNFSRTLITLALTLAPPSFARGDTSGTEGAFPLTVRVENYAGAPDRLIDSAQTHAAKIFRGFGTEILWVDCGIGSWGQAENPACLTPNGPTDLTVRLLPESQAKNFPIDPGAFGMAQPSTTGGFGYMAYIFYHRVAELCGRQYPKAPVLGHMIAHELGHLLLGLSSHSKAGIMSVPWRSKDLQKVGQDGMRFTKQQSDRIRANLLKRLEHHQPKTTARRRINVRVYNYAKAPEPVLRSAESEAARIYPLVTVRIYDHAKLRPTTLRKAEKEAARIFRLAGIDTIWLHCPLTEEELAGNRVCERDFGKSSLVLRILPESKARVLARDPREFGIAHLSERGGFAAIERSIEFPRLQAVLLGRHDGDPAEVQGQLACLIVLIGAVHQQRQRFRQRPQVSEQFAARLGVVSLAG